MENSEEPINPFHFEDQICSGLTKREYFAGLAMQAYLHTHENWQTGGSRNFAEDLAHHSIIIADELLKQLEK